MRRLRLQLLVADEAVAQQRAVEDGRRRHAGRKQALQRLALQLGREKIAGIEQHHGEDGFRRVAVIDRGDRADPRRPRLQHMDGMDVLAQIAMAAIDALRPRPDRVGQHIGRAAAGVGAGGIERDVVEPVHGLGRPRLARRQPGIGDAGHAVDQQLAVVVRRDRVARQDATRHEQRLPPGIDPAAARIDQQRVDRKPGAVGQFGQRVAELLERGDAGVVFVVVGPDLARELLDPFGAMLLQPRIVEPVIGGRGRGDRGACVTHGSRHRPHALAAARA